MRFGKSLLAGVAAACAASPFVAENSIAAERRVITEMFTATWCVYCPNVRQALTDLMEDYPDDFLAIGIHGGDSYATPWGNQRASFYGVPGYPTLWFDGLLDKVGSSGTPAQNYAAIIPYLNQRWNAPTDTFVEVNGDHISGETYRFTVRVGVEIGGQAKSVDLYLLQLLDLYPTGGNPPYRNTYIQSRPVSSINLVPGQAQVITHDFTFSGASAANHSNIKVIAWVQDPGSPAPRHVHNTNWIDWPFPSADCNGNGVADYIEIANGSAPDCNNNGLPDSCDIAQGLADSDNDGLPDICEDCNGNGEYDWYDIASGSSLDCNENLFPDECDAGTTSDDCNVNDVPDECEVALDVSETSAQLGPIGQETPVDFRINDPLDANTDVTISFLAHADLSDSFEQINVSLNGTNLANIYASGGTDCGQNAAQIVVPMATWNNAINGQPQAIITMVGNAFVNPGECGDGSWIQATVEYRAPGVNDDNNNYVPDDCEQVPCPGDVDANGTIGFSDVLVVLSTWGACGSPCPADIDLNGTVGFPDLLIILTAWGPCP